MVYVVCTVPQEGALTRSPPLIPVSGLDGMGPFLSNPKEWENKGGTWKMTGRSVPDSGLLQSHI